MAERLFYVSAGGEPGRGPLTEDAVRREVEAGVLPGDALVCEVGSTAWKSIASLDSADAPEPEGPLPPLPPPPPVNVNVPVPVPGPARSGRGFYLVFALALALVAAVAAGAFLVLRKPSPKLCPGTPKLLASLKQTVTVDAYVTRGLPKLDEFVAQLTALLAQYQAAGGGRFVFHVVEAKDEATRKQAKEAGLTEQPFGSSTEGKENEVELRQGFMGLVFRYGGEQDSIKYLPPTGTAGVEFWIDNKIRELRAKAESLHDTIGVLAGHGETAISEPNLVPASMGKPSIQGIMTQNFPFYAFHDVDLSRDAAPIPGDLQGLLVTQPSSDLSDADLARIDEFVMKGKPAAFFVGAANVRAGDGAMHATLSTHGLEKLLAGYGVELGRDLVVEPDAKSAVSISVTTSTGAARTVVPFVPVVRDEDHRLDSAYPIFFRMSEVAFPLASSIVVHEEKQPEARVVELARSSPRAVRVTGADVDLHPLQPWKPAGAEGPVLVAVALDGVLHGAFDPARKSAGRARVLVVASSQFLANPFARAANAPEAASPTMAYAPPSNEQLAMVAGPYAQQEVTATILAFKNTVDWLSFEEDLVDCSLLADAGK